MIRYLKIIFYVFLLAFVTACSSPYNKGVTNTKEFGSKKPPSVKIKEGYDRQAKRAQRGKRSLKGKEGKKLDKAQSKMKAKKMKKDKRYIKRARRKYKRNNK